MSGKSILGGGNREFSGSPGLIPGRGEKKRNINGGNSKAKGLARGRSKFGQSEERKGGQYSRNRESREECEREEW